MSDPDKARRRRAIFFDRDGVLVRAFVRDGKPRPPQTLDEFEILPGVRSALAALHAAGYLLVVVTNQPDVATGRQTRAMVEAMHDRLRRDLLIDDIKVCYHVDDDQCACRKPKPGMLLVAGSQWPIDFAASYMVGDRWRDVDAGKAAGCKAIFVDAQYNEALREKPDLTVTSLEEAAEAILSGRI